MRYSDSTRGTIYNRERAKQIIDYRGLRFKNITPTDVDGFFEHRNKVFILYEFKLKGNDVPHGQKQALERTIDALRKAHKSAVLFICSHTTEDPNIDIDAASATVEYVYLDGKWYKGNGATAKELTDRFLAFYDRIGVPERERQTRSAGCNS